MVLRYKLNRNHIFTWIMSTLIIILSGTVFVSIESSKEFRNILYVVFYLLGIFLLLRKNFKFKRKILISLLAPLGLLLISSINYPTTMFDAIKMFLIYLLLLLFVDFNRDNKEEFKQCLYYLIVFLAITSLLLFFIVELFGISLPYSIVTNGPTNYYNFYNIYFTENMFRYWVFGKEFHRIQSIFTEPGIFAIFLNYAIYLYLYERINQNRKFFAILIIAVLLTFSTTGICLVIIQLSYFFYKSLKSRQSRFILFLPLLSFASALVVYIFLHKATMDVNINGSYYLRYTDIIFGLRVWLDNFFVGTGYINHDPFLLIQPLGRGCSNGIIQWMYTTGLIGLVVLLFPFLYSILRNQKETSNKKKSIMLFVLYFLCGMTEPIVITPFMMMIVSNVVIENMQSEKVLVRGER